MSNRQVKLWLVLFFLLWPILLNAQKAQPDAIRYEKLQRGKVEHWYQQHAKIGESWFQKPINAISNIIWPEPNPPFGRSVALLTGVADYDQLDDLPSVNNDLNATA